MKSVRAVMGRGMEHMLPGLQREMEERRRESTGGLPTRAGF